MAVSASARGPQSRAWLDRPLSRHRTWPMPASSTTETDSASQEVLVGPSRCLGIGHHGKQALRETPVVFIAVLAAQPAVLDTGDARPGHVDARRGVLVRHDHRLLSLARHGARGRAADIRVPVRNQRVTRGKRARPGALGGRVPMAAS